MAVGRSQVATFDRVLRRLRAEGRVDDPIAELFVTAARGAAADVDLVCAPDSDVAVYARTRARQAHLAALRDLAEYLGPATGPVDDPRERIAAELEPINVVEPPG
jgi:hypothetical protein